MISWKCVLQLHAWTPWDEYGERDCTREYCIANQTRKR